MRPLVLAAVLPVLALAACGSDEPSGQPAPTDGRTSASSLPGRMVEHADASGCAAEKATVETAVEAYLAVNGTEPADLAALEGDFLADVSTLVYVVGLDWRTGSRCSATTRPADLRDGRAVARSSTGIR